MLVHSDVKTLALNKHKKMFKSVFCTFFMSGTSCQPSNFLNQHFSNFDVINKHLKRVLYSLFVGCKHGRGNIKFNYFYCTNIANKLVQIKQMDESH